METFNHNISHTIWPASSVQVVNGVGDFVHSSGVLWMTQQLSTLRSNWSQLMEVHVYFMIIRIPDGMHLFKSTGRWTRRKKINRLTFDSTEQIFVQVVGIPKVIVDFAAEQMEG